MFCDFIVWTNDDIHIERIYPDEDIWLSNVPKVKALFEKAVLPELLGKWFSRPPRPVVTSTETNILQHPTHDTVFCYCKG